MRGRLVAFVALAMLCTPAAAHAAVGGGTSSFSSRPSYSAPTRSSYPSTSAAKSWSPPSRPAAIPPVNRWPRGASVVVFHDTHSALYWGNPASPYHYLYVQQYGDGSDDDIPGWAVWAIVIAAVALVGGGIAAMFASEVRMRRGLRW